MSKINNYNLILMDVNLPVLDGLSATLEIRKFNQNVSIIAQTAYAMDSDRDKIFASGCNDIITKPITSDELFRLLEKYI